MTDSAALARPPIEVVNPIHAPTMRTVDRLCQGGVGQEFGLTVPLFTGGGRRHKSPMALIDRIEQALAIARLSPERASLQAGLGRDFLRNLKRRPGMSPRGDSLAMIAAALNVSVDWLLELTDDPTPPAAVRDSGAAAFQPDLAGPLPLIGVAQAGAWLDLDDGAPIPSPSHLLPDKRFPRADQYAVRLQGDSIDLVYPAGAELRVVRAAAIGYAPRRGDLVIVERRRGGLREASAKFVGAGAPKAYLLGRSRDPRWNQSLELYAPGEDVTVEIIGLVTGAFVAPPIE